MIITPGLGSELEAPKAPARIVFCPALTTSRRELPTVIAPMRRPLPLTALDVLVPSFSLVLDASDLESSG